MCDHQPPLNYSIKDFREFVSTLKDGERVQEYGTSCMEGMQGTVEIREGWPHIRWDEFTDATGYSGVMVTSFTVGARLINTTNK